MKDYYVYILTNRSGTLYVGVTNNLMRRVKEHKDGLAESFTNRKLYKAVQHQQAGVLRAGNDVEGAILREKQLKGWTRKRKIELIAGENPQWRDLSEGWYEEAPPASGVKGEILHSVQNDKSKARSQSARTTVGQSKEPAHV